jgi:hypothetical protein
LRAKRSNPEKCASKKHWIASSLSLLAMTPVFFALFAFFAVKLFFSAHSAPPREMGLRARRPRSEGKPPPPSAAPPFKKGALKHLFAASREQESGIRNAWAADCRPYAKIVTPCL